MYKTLESYRYTIHYFLSLNGEYSNANILSKQLLNAEEQLYIRQVFKLIDISATPLGHLLDNYGQLPHVLGKLDAETFVRRVIAYQNNVTTSGASRALENDQSKCAEDLNRTFKPLEQSLVCLLVALANNLCESLVPAALCSGLLPPPVPPDGTVPGFTWRMIDAATKLPSGVFEGKLHFVGSFSMCQDIIGSYERNTTNTTDSIIGSYNGQYCRVNIGPKLAENNSAILSLALGICVPDSCATPSIKDNINENGLSLILGLDVYSVFCKHDMGFNDDQETLLALGIVCFLVGLGLLATLWDIYGRKKWLSRKRNSFTADKPQTYNGKVPSPHTEHGTGSDAAGQSKLSLHSQISTQSTSELIQEKGGTMEMSAWQDQPIGLLERLEGCFVGFSFVTNTTRIFSTESNSLRFRTCDSLRTLSTFYSTAGYTMVLGIIVNETWSTGNLLTKVLTVPRYFWFQVVINYHFSADTLLVLSGFLISYHWFKRMEEKNNKLGWREVMYFYMHRYWSLMPPMVLVLMFYVCFYKHVLIGPMEPPLISDAENCRANWWTNLLMVQNLVNTDKLCLAWSFYVPMIFQLHAVTPLILIPLIIKPKLGYLSIAVFFLAHIGLTAYVSNELFDADSLLGGVNTWFFDMIITPWCRAGPYLIGIVLAVIMYRKKEGFKIPMVINVLLWLCAGVCMTSVTFATWGVLKEGGKPWNRTETIFFWCLARSAWGMAVAWVIWACEYGYGNIIGRFLQWEAWQPLSRLSYMAFLLHPIVIFWNAYSQADLIYINFNRMLYFFMGSVFLTYAASWVLSLIFQYPFIAIEKSVLATKMAHINNLGNHPGYKQDEKKH